ncbi:MAG TPA: hypothetical protein VFV07_11555 [Rhizomicrobium sp.]|nr:hypothetical protein [Rhizomicrobium sp.]
MRKVLLGIGVFLGLAFAGAWYLGLIRFGLQGTLCYVDKDPDASDQAALEAAARQGLAATLAGNIEAMRRSMSDEARATADRVGSLPQIQAYMRQNGPFTPPKLEHFYYIASSGAGTDVRMQCQAADGSGWLSLRAHPGREQAYFLFSTTGRGGDGLALTEWLVRRDGAWRVDDSAMMHSVMAGHDAADLLALARKERAAGHRFNATMLYVGARSLVDRGPFLQLPLVQTIAADEQGYAMASELAGKPPFSWGINGNVYSVGHVTIQSINGKLGLTFDLPQKSWNGTDAADAANRAFLTDFVAAHPDTAKVFAFLVARAIKPDKSSGWFTVWSAQKGFLAQAKH